MAVGLQEQLRQRYFDVLQARPAWIAEPSMGGMNEVSRLLRPIYFSYLIVYQALQTVRSLPAAALKLIVEVVQVAMQMAGFLLAQLTPRCLHKVAEQAAQALSSFYDACLGHPLMLSAAWRLLGVGDRVLAAQVIPEYGPDAALETLSSVLQISLDPQAEKINDLYAEHFAVQLKSSGKQDELYALPNGITMVPKHMLDSIEVLPIDRQLNLRRAVAAQGAAIKALGYFSVNYISRIFLFVLCWSMLWLSKLHQAIATSEQQSSVCSKLVFVLHKLALWLKGHEATYMADALSVHLVGQIIDPNQAPEAVLSVIGSQGDSRIRPLAEPLMSSPSVGSRLQALSKCVR